MEEQNLTQTSEPETEVLENPEIDPKNPFQNGTEFTDYNSDYGEIVPQIRMKGCKIPLMPNSAEKKRIHHYENIVGAFLLGHYAVTNVLSVVLMEAFVFLMSIVDGRFSDQGLPSNYHTLAYEYLENSSSYMALTMLVIAGCSILVFWLGCKATKIPASHFFQTRNFTVWNAIFYCMIAICIQTIAGWTATGIEVLMDGVGIASYDPDFSPSQDVKSVMMNVIYGVIVAPVTEELLVRGFVMKNLSRVSQHFGIIMSAFFFGVWHENIPQFILAFLAGCFFGYIDMKHNSLIPSIIAHMAVNFCATVFELLDTFHLDFAYTVFDIVYTGIVIAGGFLLLRMFFTDRFPKTTPEQAERGGRVALTSPLLVCIYCCHIATSVFLILSENM